MSQFTQEEFVLAVSAEAHTQVDGDTPTMPAASRDAAATRPRRWADPANGASTGRDGEQALEAAVMANCVRTLRALAFPQAGIKHHLAALRRIRAWTGRPLWEMTPAQADAYFGEHLRAENFADRTAQAQELTRYFVYLTGEHGAALLAAHGLGPARCPLDALNWPMPPEQPSVNPPWRRTRAAWCTPAAHEPG